MQRREISSVFFVFKNQTQLWKRFECFFLAVRRVTLLKKKKKGFVKSFVVFWDQLELYRVNIKQTALYSVWILAQK